MKKLLYIFSILILASCSSKSFPGKNWYGKQLTVVEMMGNPVQTSGSQNDAHLIFSTDNGLGGSGGCNRIYGSFTQGKRKSLRFNEIGTTRMACQNQNFENRFLDLLNQVRYYEIADNAMLLKNGKKNVILKLQ